MRGAFHAVASLAANERSRGVVTASAGNHAQGVALVARHTVSQMVRVTRGQICAAMRTVFEECRGIVEPAGALAVAGLGPYLARRGSRPGAVVAVLTGGNIDFEALGDVA